MNAPHPDPSSYWFHRRLIAYSALGGIIGIGLASLFVKLAQPQSDVLVAVVYGLTAIVGAYVGFATADRIAQRRDARRDSYTLEDVD